MSSHSSASNCRRFSINSFRSMTEIWNGVNSVTLKGRIFLLCTSVSSYVSVIVPHIPPESSIGYCRTRLSVTFTKLSLIAPMVPQYLSSVSWSRTSRLAMML